MPKQSERQGCLTGILKLFGINLPKNKQSTELLPYRLREDFLSNAEHSFYQVLNKAIGSQFTVLSKVNLADLIFVSQAENRQSHLNRINRKHVDFLLCHPDTMKPVLGIELDDKSHNKTKREERDIFVDSVFESTGLSLLRVKASQNYSPLELKEQINSLIGTHEKMPEQKTENHISKDIPTCPECNIPMILRTANQGKNKGQQFWGCSNYPNCKKVRNYG